MCTVRNLHICQSSIYNMLKYSPKHVYISSTIPKIFILRQVYMQSSDLSLKMEVAYNLQLYFVLTNRTSPTNSIIRIQAAEIDRNGFFYLHMASSLLMGAIFFINSIKVILTAIKSEPRKRLYNA